MNRINKYLIILVGCTLAMVSSIPAMAGKPQFVKNKGQWDSRIKYQMKMGSGSMILENDKVTYTLYSNEADSADHVHHHEAPKQGHVYRVSYKGADPQAEVTGEEKLPQHHNYYLGKDPSKWATDVPVYSQMRYHHLYPNIDLVYGEKNGLLEYRYELQPGAHSLDIKMQYDGVENFRVVDGDLIYSTSVTDIKETAPYAYQIINGKQQKIECTFVVTGNQVGFGFPEGYNDKYPVIIDPTLVFSSFTGSKQDNFGFTATYDLEGNAYAGGTGVNNGSGSPFPTSGYPITPGAFQPAYGGGNCDVSLSKFNTDGTALLYSTYLGGSGSETPNSMVVNHKNELLIFGITSSANFPVTANAFDTVFHGGTAEFLPDNGVSLQAGSDIFITKLDSNGHMLSSTYFGGTGNDGLNYQGNTTFNGLAYNYSDAFRGEIQVDSLDNVFVASCTSSPTLYPAIGSAIRNTLSGVQDGLVIKLSPNLNFLLWQAYIGGSDQDAFYSLDIDKGGNVYAAGGTKSNDFPTTTGVLLRNAQGDRDGILVKITGNGSAVQAATYIGTNNYDQAFFVKLGSDSNVYVTGQTLGAYPVSQGVYSNPNSSQFIHCLSPSLSTTIFSTVFGTGRNDSVNISPTAFLVDECGFIYVCGWGGRVNHDFYNLATGNTIGMPTTPNAVKPVSFGDDFYLMVLRYHADSLVYATFMGSPGSNSLEHVDGGTSRFDPQGIVYEAVCAACLSSDFFTTPGVVAPGDSSYNCNEAIFKFDLQIAHVAVTVQANPNAVGCAPFTINFNSQGVNAVTYQWDFGDGHSSTLANPTYTYTVPGTYQVKLIGLNPNICPTKLQKDSAFLTIIVKPDSQVVTHFIPQTINNCDSFSVAFNNTSTGGAQYTWDFGDGNTSSAVSPQHTYTHAGTFFVKLTATNLNTCNLTDDTVATITFKPRLVTTLNIHDTTVCTSSLVSFFNQTVGSGAIQYSWNFGDGSATSQAASPVHNYPSAGTYNAVLTVTDTGTCNQVLKDSLTVTVVTDSLHAAFGLTVLQNTCDTLTVSLLNQSTGADSIRWYFGDGVTSTANNPTHTYHQPGTYTIQLVAIHLNGICTKRDTAAQTVTLKPRLLAAIATHDTSGCKPFRVKLTSLLTATAAHTTQWDFGNGTANGVGDTVIEVFVQAGTYHVVLTTIDTNTCNVTVKDTVTITVIEDTLHAAFDLTELHRVCDTLNIQLTDRSSGGTVAWDFGDGTTSAIASPQHSYHGADTFYILQIVTGQHCNTKDTVRNQVVLLPRVTALFTPADGCIPYAYQPINNSTNATTYLWHFKNDTSTKFNPVINYPDTGRYNISLTAYNPHSCNDSSTYSASINVYPTPYAHFTMDSDSFAIFHDVPFHNQSTLPAHYDWAFGDGNISNDTDPIHRYRQDGIVYPCLTVTDTHTCKADFCDTLNITFLGIVDVPNAFSPNGDGSNDVLYVRGYGVDDMVFRVYNRWGELVFESHRLEDGWDGTYKGSPQEMEVYAFTLEAHFINGLRSPLRKGNITLLR